MEKRIERSNGNQSREAWVTIPQTTSTSLGTDPAAQSMPSSVAASSGAPISPVPHSHVSQRTGHRASSNHQADLERLRKLKEEILKGHDPHFYAHPRPDALEALSLRHNPAVISSPSVTDQTTHEPMISSANDGSRTHTDQLPRQSSAPHRSDQNSIAPEASAPKQPRQLSQTADSSRAIRQDDQEARPEPTTTDAERMFPNTSSSNYTITNGSLNGKRPLTPTVSALASGRNGLPTTQSMASTKQSAAALALAPAGVKEHGMKPEMSTAFAENAPSSPSIKDELNSLPAHKIPPRPNPGGPLGVSIPLSAGSRDTNPLNGSRTTSSLGGRPEPVLLKRSEFEAMEKEKDRMVQKPATDHDETSRSAKPGQEGDPVRSRGLQHDVYIPERSPSPHRTSDALLAAEARPRGVQHDVYVPPPTPPATIRDPDMARPKGGSRDVYVPPPSPSRERELRARLDTTARYDSRLDRGETYRPESEREQERDRDRDRGRDRDRERGADTIDVRRPEYRDHDRRGDRYEDMRDTRARSDDRSYLNASRALPSTVDAKPSDARALRLASPPPRSLAERLDLRDVRPPATDSYRSRDVYDNRNLRGPDRESLREPLYRVPLSPPRRAPSPVRSVRREPDYRSSTAYSPRSYEPTPQDWSREDAATYESRRAMWPEEERRREYERDRAPLDAVRREDYDRRPPYPPASSRPDPRDWPPSSSDPPSADYYRTVDPVKPPYPSSSYTSTADRYPPEMPPVSRVRPRSPSPAPYRTNPVGYIAPNRPTHPESEVARNAKRARMMEALQQGRQVPSSNQPPHLARQGPDYHPPTRTSSTPAYDGGRDSRRTSQRSSSPMREVEYPPPRPRSPAPPSSSYRPAEVYPRSASPSRHSWDRDGARYAPQRL